MTSFDHLFQADNTVTRMDRMGLDFIDNPDSLSAEEALELFADLIDCRQQDVYDCVTGDKLFVPIPDPNPVKDLTD